MWLGITALRLMSLSLVCLREDFPRFENCFGAGVRGAILLSHVSTVDLVISVARIELNGQGC